MRTIRFVGLAIVVLATLQLCIHREESRCLARAHAQGASEAHVGLASGCRVGPLDAQAPRTR